MVGKGLNRKSIAYVENLAAFIEHTVYFEPGIYIYNYADKPDFTMEFLVLEVNRIVGNSNKNIKIPFFIGFSIGKIFDLAAWVTNKKFAISSIRVKKFCSNSVYSTSVSDTNFQPPVQLSEALERTIRYEFLEKNYNHEIFYSE